MSGAAEGQPPLLRYLDRWEVTLGPGELLFVPAGAAHAVTNLSHTAAISANFVDSTNLDLFREELSVAACSKCPALAVPQLSFCASSGRAWGLRLARTLLGR